jgi:hypothetical protein
MENVQEVVHQGIGGFLVPKPSINSDPPVEKLYEAVVSLLENRNLYQRMSEYNLSLITDGLLSVRQRDKTLRGLYGASGPHTAPSSSSSLLFLPPAHENHADQTQCYEWQSSAVTSTCRDFQSQQFPATKTGFLVPSVTLSDDIMSLGKFSTREKRVCSSINIAIMNGTAKNGFNSTNVPKPQ